MKVFTNKLFGSALLIAGTCIGAGMLALPVSTAASGFFPSIAILIIMWFAMYLTGLYVLEANLNVRAESNFVSMAKAALGKWGEVAAWLTYLLLLYSLMAAYLSGGGAIFVDVVKSQLHLSLGNWVGPLPWVFVIGLIIYLGARNVDGLNRILMIGLVATYFILILLAAPKVQPQHFVPVHPGHLFVALPIVITAFGYHVIIPSIRVYMKSDVKRLKRIVLFGSLTPLIVYILWEFIVFGTIPIVGDNGLTEILKSGQPATELTHALAGIIHNHFIVLTSRLFAFFAIASSFLGISFSIFDFIADGFAIRKTLLGRLYIAIITFLPPLLFSWLYPHGFIMALAWAGVFVAILHGILPALMVWQGRKKELSVNYQAPGGLMAMILIILFSIVVISAQFVVNI